MAVYIWLIDIFIYLFIIMTKYKKTGKIKIIDFYLCP